LEELNGLMKVHVLAAVEATEEVAKPEDEVGDAGCTRLDTLLMRATE
jgi:hypothetical protein